MAAALAQSGLADRARRALLVGLILTMPVTVVLHVGANRAVNVAASDVLMPAGIAFLVWSGFRGKLRLASFGLFCLTVFAIELSLIMNFDDSLEAKGSIGLAVEAFKIIALWYQFYVVVNCIETPADFLLATRAWFAGSVPIALSGIYGSLSYQMTGAENDFALMFRAEGTLGDSNLFAGYLGLSLLFGLLLWKIDPSWRKWVLVIVPIQVAGIFFSASRGTMLSLTVVLCLLIGIAMTWKMRMIAGGCAFVVALGAGALMAKSDWLASNPFTERLATTTVNVNDDSASDRKTLWVDALERFEGSPLFGVGRGNFRPLDERDKTKTGAVHDMFLGIACETGILGVIAYALALLRYAFEMLMDRFAARRRFPASTRILLCGLMLLMLCGLTISLENFRGLWMLVGFLEAYRRLFGSYGLSFGGNA
jgi:O-antigen ligase